MIDPIWVLGGLVAGALAGSFLSTIVLRWPAGKSAMRGRSACDGCGRTLTAIELIPFASALMSRGKCRTCGAGIDPLHWRMEAACVLIGGGALAIMPDIGGVLWALLGWMLLALAILDARHFWLPDALTLPLAFVGLTVGEVATAIPLTDRVIGAAVGYAALALIATAYRLLRGREGLGLGDAKLLGVLGGWFGWHALPFQLLTASLLGLLVVAGLRVGGGKIARDTRIPLGTFLCIAAVPGWLIAEHLLR